MSSIASVKRTVIEKLLDEENYILIVVNPQVEGVKLPKHLLESNQLIGLHIGYRMAIPVPDLAISDDGISGTLSFSQIPHLCFLPWSAIAQVTVDDEHLIWIIPPSKRGATEAQTPPKASKKPHLKLVT